MKRRIIHKKEIGSTNTYLKNNYAKYDNGTILYADHQTEGKGRISHSWYDEKKQNLLMSVLFKDSELEKHLQQITLVVAVVMYKVLSKYISGITIKWPNDIYVNGQKICGILTEGVMVNTTVDAIIIGIGLNVNGVNYPREIVELTTSLKLLTKKTFRRKKILKEIMDTLFEEIELLKKGSVDYLEIIKNNFYLQNKKINFERNGIIDSGIVLGINELGQLVVKTSNETLYLFSGEVTLKK